MILIDGTKYSCSECIRGHRSSSCRHYMRALLQVRSKGRPNFQFSSGNKNHRIAVFAEEVADSPDPVSASCKDVPVVILKTSDKQVIDMTNGRIVGPYRKEEVPFQSSNPVITSDNFLVSSSCCSDGASKVRKSCSCNQKKVSKSKILKSYIDKKIQQQNAIKESPSYEKVQFRQAKSCCKKNDKITAALKCEEKEQSLAAKRSCSSESYQYSPNTTTYPKMEHVSINQSDQKQFSSNDEIPDMQTSNFYASSSTNDVFEVINVPNCSLPGTCSCSTDCACPNCMTHNNYQDSKNSRVLDFLNNDSQLDSNLILTSNPGLRQSIPQTHMQPTFQNGSAPSLSFPNALNPDSYALPSSGNLHQSHGQNPEYAMQNRNQSDNLVPLNGSSISNSNFRSPFPNISSLSKDFDAYNNILSQVIGSTIMPAEHPSSSLSDESEDSNVCTCADDACNCANCETHGIIDGYKLDDIFVSKAPLDNFPRVDLH
ncbi:putative metal-binding activator [Clavispora lusitaniae]|uniref:Metal-binding activator n=1 Tax=Clavispora lusitaniae TaxID=36911 RepID=A0ACD0WNN7_CLALS|nr:putative metal-binding activator [Clavispora lusitaniae]QFZ34637.1 putative metal-binding activator [Clavispora lusitaniae]QFZ40322.1 putative metal-binding activator [Clavispora lusitaniae]QFZ46002.1 putative metal-binding activator [Clavispora lusitaniae]QFZ51664.1 putative metal-binding activator [Clavispora lusitaniae]